MSRFEMISVTSAAPARSTGAKNEVDKKAYWAERLSLPVYENVLPVGHLLTLPVSKGSKETLAERLLTAGGFALSTVRIGAFDFPLLPGFEVALETGAPWFCPMCNSAHGTSVGASKNAPAKVSNLNLNKWFYNVATLELFTVSTSCWDNYVDGTPAKARFLRSADRKMYEQAMATFAALTAPAAPAAPAATTAPTAPTAPAATTAPTAPKTAPAAPAKPSK